MTFKPGDIVFTLTRPAVHGTVKSIGKNSWNDNKICIAWYDFGEGWLYPSEVRQATEGELESIVLEVLSK